MVYRGQRQVPVSSPSFFVCLRGPSCAFVDSSFFLLFPRRGVGGIPGNARHGSVKSSGSVKPAGHHHDFARFEQQRFQPFRLHCRHQLPDISARSGPAQREMGRKGTRFSRKAYRDQFSFDPLLQVPQFLGNLLQSHPYNPWRPFVGKAAQHGQFQRDGRSRHSRPLHCPDDILQAFRRDRPQKLEGQVDIVRLDPTDLGSALSQPLLDGGQPIPGERGKLETNECSDGFHGREQAGGRPGWFQSRTTKGGGLGVSSRQYPRLNATDSVRSSTNGPVW